MRHFTVPIVVVLLALTAVLGSATAAYDDGDLFLLSAALPDGAGGSMYGIVKIDPPSGVSTLHYAADTVLYPQFTYDRQRDLLVFAQADSGLVGLASDGIPTILNSPPSAPNGLAARGDGIIYLRIGLDFFYLDAVDNLLPLLDATGTAGFSAGSGGSQLVLHYDAGTNALIVFTHDANFGPCSTSGAICAAKIPLTGDGTQVAGPMTGVSVDVSTSTEQIVGAGARDAGGIVFVVDTNSNSQEPRMQLLDPVAMTTTSFASSGSFTGAAAISAGTYSNVLGMAVLDDSFHDILRGYAQGTAGSGVTLSSGATGWGVSSGGHSELARLIEIERPVESGVLPEVITSGARLLAPRPNPFNPSTTLRFHLAASQAAQLEIYDVRGAHVRTLARGVRSAGWHEVRWNGRDDAGRRVVSGMYFARLAFGTAAVTQRLVLVE